MSEPPTLENELERRITQSEEARVLWAKYQNVRNYLTQNYYHWIQANAPFLTNHGKLHIDSVIQAADGLLIKQLTGKGKARKELSDLDIFLLLSAILWHDVGNVYGRIGHPSRIAEMTDQIKELGFPNPDIQRFVVEVARAHSGKGGLTDVRIEEDCSTEHGTYTVYPRALAGVVRFADEISENRARISPAMLSSVPEKNRIYWEYANAISASRPDPARRRVILTVTLDQQKACERFECRDFANCQDAHGKISLIEYIICRIEKMNHERVYCTQCFSRYATIDEIECRLTLVDGPERKLEEVILVGSSGLGPEAYPDINIVQDFFERYPIWKPEAIGKVGKT
jgi:hypothetical protein